MIFEQDVTAVEGIFNKAPMTMAEVLYSQSFIRRLRNLISNLEEAAKAAQEEPAEAEEADES